MVIGETVNVSADILSGAVTSLGKIALFLQALGVVILLWIIFQVIMIVLTKRRKQVLLDIQKHLDSIDSRLDKIENILKNKKNKK